MNTTKTNITQTLAHQQAQNLVVDFGATPVTGVHVLSVQKLRKIFGLKDIQIKIIEPFQMLGEIDDELSACLNRDFVGLGGNKDMFGITNANCNWKPFETPWGQKVLVPEAFNTTHDNNGNVLIYPEGDVAIPPSGRLLSSGYFFDAINRQPPIDDANLNPEDNLEEFGLWDESTIKYWEAAINDAPNEKGLVVNPGGTAIGDIALVPGVQLKNPKGIRDVTEWYMSTMMRTDYLHEVFTKQTDIAIQNLQKLNSIAGDKIDVLFVCATDFGTQNSTFISEDQFRELYMPYYKKINNWIHTNTSWLTFKHSCGAIEPFINLFIESGFDVLNPVQISAAGMEPENLKNKYGKDIVFWGGGIDTQKVLSFAKPEEVRTEVLKNCEIFAKDGGFVFNTVHNTQANVPIENLEAMIKALDEFKG